MVKFLEKFKVHCFIHAPRKGKVGVILTSSHEKELHIGWLSGKKQVVKLNPGNRKEANELKRIKKYKALEVGNFCIYAGLPTRILKILTDQDKNLIIVNTESICIPGQELDDSLLTRILLQQMKIYTPNYSEIAKNKVGDILKVFIKFWI